MPVTAPASDADWPRYAVYFAPRQGSAWWQFGAHWLGRNEVSGLRVTQHPPPAGMAADDWQRMTDDPRRYGFHATIKAPFRLTAGTTLATLFTRVARLAESLRPVPLGAVEPVAWPNFVALRPIDAPPALARLAEVCVSALDDLRAPLTAEELARRRPESLDARGRELLQRYGYPHVMERYRFHLTLAVCDKAVAPAVVEAARRATQGLSSEGQLTVDRLCVFEQRHRGAAFLRLRDFELGASVPGIADQRDPNGSAT
jgi:putative phosphonate metabolism protein